MPVGPATVTLSGGEIINLYDDGVAVDIAAGDGIFTGTWIPAKESDILTFSSPAGTEVIDLTLPPAPTPAVRVNPSTMPSVTLEQDFIITQTLTIFNDGNGDLNFDIDIADSAGLSKLGPVISPASPCGPNGEKCDALPWVLVYGDLAWAWASPCR